MTAGELSSWSLDLINPRPLDQCCSSSRGSRVTWTEGFPMPLPGQCESLQSLLSTYWESERESGGINPRRGDQPVAETLTSMVTLTLVPSPVAGSSQEPRCLCPS